MKRRIWACAAACVVALAGLISGCGGGGQAERPLRDLPADVSYTVKTEAHTVTYTDSQGKEISLYGQIAAPDEAGKFPAVLLSHGFNGHYTDFPKECERFAARGYVCYAFDFCGAQANGKSTGRTFSEYTPFTMKEDLKAAVKDVAKLPGVDGSQIFLFGGSQGGLVTALTAADPEIKDMVAAIAMYFPAFNIPDDWRGKSGTQPLMGYYIGDDYIRSVQELDPFAEIGAFRKDVCIVWGTADALVARRYIDGAVSAYGSDRVDLTVLEGAGHGFAEPYLTQAVEKVLAFLEAHTYA